MTLLEDLSTFAEDSRFLDGNQKFAQLLASAIRANGRNQLSTLRRQEVGRSLQNAATFLEERIERAGELDTILRAAPAGVLSEPAVQYLLAEQAALAEQLQSAVAQARTSADEMMRTRGISEYAGPLTAYLDRLEYLNKITRSWTSSSSS